MEVGVQPAELCHLLFRRHAAPADRLLHLPVEHPQVVATSAGNHVLGRTVGFLLNTPLYARAYHAYADLSKRASISDHGRMIELLEAADPDACEQFWREHLYRGRNYMIEHLNTGTAGG